ncbi:MAG: hypothetical protein RLZZ630_1942 [Bacteroidota bacterium]
MRNPGLVLVALFVIIWTDSYSSFPEKSPGSDREWDAGVQTHAGFLMAHRPVIAHLQQKHSNAIQCYLLKKMDGSKSWHSDYGLPYIGLSYRMTDFGNREEIGLGHSVVMMARFPLFPQAKKWQSAIDFGYGLGFIERPFDVESNYKNLASGSIVNAAFSLAMTTSYPLNPHLRIRGGIDFLHFSNGAARMPNLGLNVPGLLIGLNYRFDSQNHTDPNRSVEKASPTTTGTETAFYKRTRAYAAYAVKEIYPPNDGAYSVYMLNAQHHRTAGKKGLFGGGLDMIYDTSLPTKLSRETGKPKNNGSDAFIRGGAFGSAGLQMGPWSAYLQVGAYLVNPVKSDGDVYNRLALHYQFKKGLFLCMNLKSHFGKADYMEWGAGYSF